MTRRVTLLLLCCSLSLLGTAVAHAQDATETPSDAGTSTATPTPTDGATDDGEPGDGATEDPSETASPDPVPGTDPDATESPEPEETEETEETEAPEPTAEPDDGTGDEQDSCPADGGSADSEPGDAGGAEPEATPASVSGPADGTTMTAQQQAEPCPAPSSAGPDFVIESRAPDEGTEADATLEAQSTVDTGASFDAAAAPAPSRIDAGGGHLAADRRGAGVGWLALLLVPLIGGILATPRLRAARASRGR